MSGASLKGRKLVERIEKVCKHCEVAFEVLPWMANRIFCSHSCAAADGAVKRFEAGVYGHSWSHRAKTFYESVPDEGRWCGICGTKTNGKYRLYVDHNHETDEIRGLLCNRCNSGVAFFEKYAEETKRYLDG